jgi:hypothetical protein
MAPKAVESNLKPENGLQMDCIGATCGLEWLSNTHTYTTAFFSLPQTPLRLTDFLRFI